MHGTWELFATLLSLAVVVAVSPFSILPVVLLVLHSSRPKTTGLAFLIGWLVGKATVTTLFVVVPHLFTGLDGPSPRWTLWVRIGVGVLLIAGGIWRWVTRKAATKSSNWLDALGKITPVGAGAIGLALTVVNVKILLVCATAGLAIGTAGLSVPMSVASVAYFTVIAGSTAAIPLLTYVMAADRIEGVLQRSKLWIERNEGTLTAVLLVVIGVLLALTGIREL